MSAGQQPADARVVELRTKGDAVYVAQNFAQTGLPAAGYTFAVPIDCRHLNAIALICTCTGTTWGATISVYGSEDDKGVFLPLPDAGSSQAIAADAVLECPVSTHWAKVNISNFSGTFVAGQGLTIVAVPYFSAGVTNVNVSNTANANLTDINGTGVGVANPLPVELSNGTTGITNPAQDGTDGTGITPPTGAVGIRGWLSGIFSRLVKGQATMAASLPVAIASDQSAVPISGSITAANPTAGTAAQSSVAGSATSVTLLAANAARLGATFYNDSAATLYLRLGSAAASTTSYTVQLAANGYFELPFGWTGAVTGIWSSATGSVRISELSA